MMNPFPPPDFPTMYRCIGILKGQYVPGRRFPEGVVLTPDGELFPATLLKTVSRWLQKHPDRISESHVWSAWVRTRKEFPYLTFDLVCIHHSPEAEEEVRGAIDYFAVRGTLASQRDSQFAIRIRRNGEPPAGKEQATDWQSFFVVVDGSLPGGAHAQFWELDCHRDGKRLVLESGRLIADAPPQPAEEQPEKQERPPVAAEERHASAKHTKAAEGVNASTPKSQSALKTTERGTILALKKADLTVPGRMEITLKIGQFPPNARTTTNGWKEFEVDTGEKLVTIQVKPKVFKKLEEAQQKYPMWVAVIVGKMGAATPNGFMLDAPAIQVFEKKPKEQPSPSNASALQ